MLNTVTGSDFVIEDEDGAVHQAVVDALAVREVLRRHAVFRKGEAAWWKSYTRNSQSKFVYARR